MRNCSPRFVREYVNRDGITVRVYVDDLTGTVLAAYDFETARQCEERRETDALKVDCPVTSPRLGYHKRKRS